MYLRNKLLRKVIYNNKKIVTDLNEQKSTKVKITVYELCLEILPLCLFIFNVRVFCVISRVIFSPFVMIFRISVTSLEFPSISFTQFRLY